jgi:hypothetical protein
LKIFRSYDEVGNVLGLVTQSNETSNTFLNMSGRCRCSPSYPKFTTPLKQLGVALPKGGKANLSQKGRRSVRVAKKKGHPATPLV